MPCTVYATGFIPLDMITRAMKSTFTWDVISYSPYKSTNVSEKPTNSIFRVKPNGKPANRAVCRLILAALLFHPEDGMFLP
jgi:hypothetical protein